MSNAILGSNMYAILDDKKNIVYCDIMQWSHWFEYASKNNKRRVGLDNVSYKDNIEVSISIFHIK